VVISIKKQGPTAYITASFLLYSYFLIKSTLSSIFTVPQSLLLSFCPNFETNLRGDQEGLGESNFLTCYAIFCLFFPLEIPGVSRHIHFKSTEIYIFVIHLTEFRIAEIIRDAKYSETFTETVSKPVKSNDTGSQTAAAP
jgi:hypothetical protein